MTKIPEGWAESTIPQVAEVLDTKRIPINSDERAARIDGKSQQSLVAYYGATGQVGWIDTHLFDEDLVLLGEDGVSFLDPGKPKAYRVSGKSWVNNHAHVLRARQDALDWRLLEAQLNTLNYTGHVTGSTRLKLTQGAMNKLPILVPPLAEQKRIADKLDTVLTRVDAVNTRLVRVAPLLKRFRQSVLAAAFTGRLTNVAATALPSSWQTVTLGSLITHGPKNGLYKPSSAYGDGVRILRIDSFYDGKVSDWGGLRLLSVDSSELKQFGLKNGDIVINRVNSIEYLGKCALIEGLQGECVFESNMMKFRLSSELANPHFVRAWLCSEDARTQIVGKAKHAVNQASINQSDVCSLKLQLPPLSEQTEIVRRVETLFAFADRLEARLAQAQTAATRLTPALLAKAFRGELVPQDPNDEPAAELLRRLQAERASAPKASAGRGRKAAVRSEG